MPNHQGTFPQNLGEMPHHPGTMLQKMAPYLSPDGFYHPLSHYLFFVRVLIAIEKFCPMMLDIFLKLSKNMATSLRLTHTPIFKIWPPTSTVL